MSTILILTHSEDGTAGMVIQHLQKMCVPYRRFNTDQFQKSVGLSIELDQNGDLCGRYHFSDGDLDFREIGVVWNRRVKEPVPQIPHSDPEIRDWSLQETKYALYNSFTLIDAPIVNPWEDNERIKFNKLVQMKRAAEMGFRIPKTLLTSSPQKALDFCRQTLESRSVVLKKIKKGLLTLNDGRRLLLHTSVIPRREINHTSMEGASDTPLFLQEHVGKRYDVRSVVVADEVFSFAIHSQKTRHGKTDYRTAAVLGEEIQHEAIDLGADINKRLIEYTKSFGLVFSAIDLILTTSGEIVFLENNPNGQWGWLEETTGSPISKAFAVHLANKAERC